MLKGQHLIAGQWRDGPALFENAPLEGPADRFATGTTALIAEAAEASDAAFVPFAATSRAQRARFLRQIAKEIDARGEAITAMGVKETGLPEARLIGERGRTTGQLRYFADHIEAGDYLDRRRDDALPDRAPLPRPEIRLMQRPIGPVAVFGASNFPLAFSTAGGDTAAALAAGCPVVVKGHPAHPGTSDLVAQAIAAAVTACDMPAGVFSLVQDSGADHSLGAALVQHPLIKAVGFTGSLRAGRALFDLCAARPEPIPFFGELGSVNPMFLLPEAMAARGPEIASGWAGSLTMGAGQFCTNPGIAVVLAGDAAETLAQGTATALEAVAAQVMLTDGIASAYADGRSQMAELAETLLSTKSDGRNATPHLLQTTAAAFLAEPQLSHEVFGPLGLIVVAKDADEMMAVAQALDGQLTATLHMEPGDAPLARALLPVLERKAGRILANGFPTGVEVCDAMVHGGPYPASTNFGATSVGAMAIRRFLRPVSYQNIPADLLPDDL